jgi:hypothetical protein
MEVILLAHLERNKKQIPYPLHILYLFEDKNKMHGFSLFGQSFTSSTLINLLIVFLE